MDDLLTADELWQLVDVLYRDAVAKPRWPRFLERLAESTGSLAVWIGQRRWAIGERILMGHPDSAAQAQPSAHPIEQLTVTVAADAAGDIRLTLSRDVRSGRYGDAHRRLLEHLLPHLRRALRLAERMAAARGEHRLLHAAADRLQAGLLLVDRAGRPLDMNLRLAEQLGGGGSQALATGLPAAIPRHDRAGLQRLLEQTTADRDRRPAPGRRHWLRRSGSGVGTAVVPLERAGNDGALTAVFVCDPRHRDPPPAELLREVLGLSPREALLALLLARGTDLKRAATELSIRPATARTHLKRIFYKTGVHRQAALVGLLHRLLGPVRFESSAPSASSAAGAPA